MQEAPSASVPTGPPPAAKKQMSIAEVDRQVKEFDDILSKLEEKYGLPKETPAEGELLPMIPLTDVDAYVSFETKV